MPNRNRRDGTRQYPYEGSSGPAGRPNRATAQGLGQPPIWVNRPVAPNERLPVAVGEREKTLG
jgi:hypothetical protein